MAEVHLAASEAQAGFTKLVVLKKTRLEFAQDPDFMALFLDEARLAARLNHPNVVQTYEVSSEGEQNVMVMEYLEGQPFNVARGARRSAARMPLEMQLRVLSDVLSGLHHAHELCDYDGTPLNVVHRDVTPHNVFVTYDGQVKVLDFGIAKASVASVQTQAGAIKGKLAYMPPEQARGQPVDRRADLFAVGVMLFEAITDRRMWGDTPDSGIYFHLSQGNLPPLPELLPGAPAPLADVARRALALAPADRFATALDMQAEIERCARQLPAVSPRDLGQFVSQRFAEQRARIRRTIEAQLSDLRLSGSVPRVRNQQSVLEMAPESRQAPASVPPPSTTAALSARWPEAAEAPEAPPPSLPTAAPVHAPASAPEAAPAPSAGPRRWMASVLLAAGGVAVGVAGGTWLALRSRTLPAQASSSPPPPSAAASPPPAASSSAAASAASAAAPACPAGMVHVEGGDFYMGFEGAGAMEFERPAHPVKLSPFCIDVTEVTVEAYRACSDQGKCPRAARDVAWPGISPRERKVYGPLCNAASPGRDRHPINCVSWEMALNYCERRGKRLPTSAEWEYAVRGPDGRIYPWGDEPPDANRLNACGKECVEWGKKNGVFDLSPMHNEDDGFPSTAPVGSFPKGRSRYGLDDVIGNVMEWVYDWDGPYDKAAQTDPKGPASGAERVIRGGAWNAGHAAWVRPSFRFRQPPEATSHGVGFRCAAGASAM